MKTVEEFSILKGFYLMTALSAITNLSYSIFIIYLLAINFSATLIGVGFALISIFIIFLRSLQVLLLMFLVER